MTFKQRYSIITQKKDLKFEFNQTYQNTKYGGVRTTKQVKTAYKSI